MKKMLAILAVALCCISCARPDPLFHKGDPALLRASTAGIVFREFWGGFAPSRCGGLSVERGNETISLSIPALINSGSHDFPLEAGDRVFFSEHAVACMTAEEARDANRILDAFLAGRSGGSVSVGCRGSASSVEQKMPIQPSETTRGK